MIAPIKASIILLSLLVRENFADNPIIITLPQVKSVILWNPINKSVIKKLNINTGKYHTPNSAGT